MCVAEQIRTWVLLLLACILPLLLTIWPWTSYLILQQVLEWHFVQCHFIILLMRGKKTHNSWQGHCLCGVCLFFPCLPGFSLGTPISFHISKKYMLIGMPLLCQSERVWVYLWVCAVMEELPLQGGVLPVLWVAQIESSHLWTWKGISLLENNDLTCFYSSLLNVCIAQCFMLEVFWFFIWWYFCDQKYTIGT